MRQEGRLGGVPNFFCDAVSRRFIPQARAIASARARLAKYGVPKSIQKAWVTLTEGQDSGPCVRARRARRIAGCRQCAPV